MSVRLPKRRFSVDDYYRMAEAGILRPTDRVELIDGEVVVMSPIGSRHAGCVNRLTRLLIAGLGTRAVVAVQNPVRLSPFSEPVPDVALLKPRAGDYSDRHPTPEDILLLIEVGVSSLPVDRGVKAPLYARAGILEYWLVDLEQGHVEVFRDPAHYGYEANERAAAGAVLRPHAFPDLALDVAEIIGSSAGI